MSRPYCAFLSILVVALAGIFQARAGDAHFDKQKALAEWTSLAKNVKSMRYVAVTECSQVLKGKPSKDQGQYVEKYAWSQAGFLVGFESMLDDQKGNRSESP